MSFALIVAGFMLLAAGTWRSSALIFDRVLQARLRHVSLAGGYSLLASSLVSVLAANDTRMLVEWVGQLTVAAIILLLALWTRQQLR